MAINSNDKVIHRHVYIDKGDIKICRCGKTQLKLELTEVEGIRVGMKSDGRHYTVRDHRIRYFFPGEWLKFYDEIKDSNKLIFDFLIQTGARINEVLHVRPYDFDFDRNTVRLWKTKTRAALGERSGKPRTIIVSPTFIKRVRKYLRDNEIGEQSMEFLFPSDVNPKSPITKQGVYRLLRRGLIRSDIKDPWNFSLHNIRKTHGNWLRAIGVDSGEICLRLGHDLNTFQKHYGSPTVFNETDIRQIERILEGLYDNRRRY